jgi:hypothetical protein
MKPLLAFVAVALAFLAVYLVISHGGQTGDEDAIRAWFATPAGGGAPKEARNAIHFDEPCLLTDAMYNSHQVTRCGLTTDAPTPVLHTCFVVVSGRAIRGGWQLANLDGCNALRYDTRSGMLIDLAARQRYPITG